MSESVEQLAAMLLAAAIKEGREDYVHALQNLVPVKESLAELAKNPDQFDDTWKQRLLRTSYSVDDVNAMFENNLLGNQAYLNFTAEAIANVTDKSTQYTMVKHLLKHGKYGPATRAVEGIDDVADFALWLSTQSTIFKRSRQLYFRTIGDEKAFTREAAILFDMLGLEVPDDFDGDYRQNEAQWSASKFSAAVEWVSELCDAPRAKVGQDGVITISDAPLVKAFQEERSRVTGKGQWHQDVFPSFVPVLADTRTAVAMEAKGYVRLTPEYGVVGVAADGKGFVGKPSHNFTSISHPDMDAEQISAAMTFLSYDQITQLRVIGSEDCVFLIPAETDIKLEACGPTPDLLRIAMRYHRPEYLCSKYKGNVYKFDSTGLSTRAYLRGVPAASPLHNSGLRLHWELLDSPVFLRALNSPQEIALLQEILNPRASAPLETRLTQPQHLDSLADQVQFSSQQYEALIEKVGFAPSVMFKGTEVFLRAFADELTNRGLDVSGANTTRYIGNPGATSANADQRRLDARLGLLRYSPYRDMPMEDLFTKGCRLKGDTDKVTICGILDRLGVVGVAKMARTPTQRKFVIENFDVKTHYKDLPKALRLEIGGQILEDDLGM